MNTQAVCATPCIVYIAYTVVLFFNSTEIDKQGVDGVVNLKQTHRVYACTKYINNMSRSMPALSSHRQASDATLASMLANQADRIHQIWY